MKLQFALRASLIVAVAFCGLMAPDMADKLVLLVACFGIAATAVIQLINE